MKAIQKVPETKMDIDSSRRYIIINEIIFKFYNVMW